MRANRSLRDLVFPARIERETPDLAECCRRLIEIDLAWFAFQR